MDFDKKLKIAKGVISLIVTSGTAKIVRDIIENNVDMETTTDKVKVAAGSFAIGGLVASETAKYTDQKIDECVEQYQKLRRSFQEKQSEEQ